MSAAPSPAGPPSAMVRVATVFVYGTLKQGFANFAVNGGRRVPGRFRTVERFPLYLVGERGIPWLLDDPGRGEHVCGQLFEVSAATLAAMDRLERLGEPGWYTRRPVAVRRIGEADAPPHQALAYFGDADRLRDEPVLSGPIEAFTYAHDRRYRFGAG